MPPRVRVLVVGAGALGSVYGAALARAGADVQLLARRAHAEAVEAAGGIEVDGLDGRWRAALRAEWRPERIAAAEIVIVLTKSHDTDAALAALPQVRDHARVVVSLQNGVEKDRRLAAWCGEQRVLGGMSMVGATLERPGSVRHTLVGATYLGELAGGASARARELAELLERGGLPAVATDRVLSAEWSKLVHAAPTMTLTGLARLPFHAVLLDPGLAVRYVRLLREGAAVAAAAGVALDDWPGMFPVRTLAAAPEEEAVALVRERGRAMAAANSTAVRVSMLSDIERGRRLEVDAVHGFLVAEAERRGVPVPLSRVAHELLCALDAAAGARA